MVINKRTTLELFMHFVRSYPRESSLMLMCLMVAALVEGIGIAALLPALHVAIGDSSAESPLGKAIDHVFDMFGMNPSLGVLITIVVITIFMKGALMLLAMKQVGYIIAFIAKDLRMKAIDGILGAKWKFFTSQPVGRIANALSTEATRASETFESAFEIIAGIVQVSVYVALAFFISVEVMIAAVLVGTVLNLAMSWLVAIARRAGEEQTNLTKSLITRLTDGIIGLKALKAMAKENALAPLLEAETVGLQKAQEKQVLSKEVRLQIQEPIIMLFLAIGLYVAHSGLEVALGTLIVMAVLFNRTVSRIGKLQRSYQDVVVSESAYWSLWETIEAASHAKEVFTGIRKPSLNVGIKFDNVDFSYGENQVLEQASMYVPAGRFAALTGESGAGKSTIADLIIGLYLPQNGRVLLDDIPISDVDMAAWRRMVGYVPQETLLFHDTIAHNVAMGEESFSQKDIENALRGAGAWDFVKDLPDGINTVVGERGARFSGGQRQRISIARAIIRKPRLLILDEVTTALDPKTEEEICRTILSLHESDVTVLAISHQSAIVNTADVIYKVGEGRIELVEDRKAVNLA